jgi:hypothetical protein
MAHGTQNLQMQLHEHNRDHSSIEACIAICLKIISVCGAGLSLSWRDRLCLHLCRPIIITTKSTTSISHCAWCIIIRMSSVHSSVFPSPPISLDPPGHMQSVAWNEEKPRHGFEGFSSKEVGEAGTPTPRGAPSSQVKIPFGAKRRLSHHIAFFTRW